MVGEYRGMKVGLMGGKVIPLQYLCRRSYGPMHNDSKGE